MTTTVRSATQGIDYSQFEGAIGLNWYDVDPNLQFQVQRLVGAEDRAWTEDRLRRMGALIGGPVAARAEVTDKNPPRLERYDRNGNEVNTIVHHPSALETKRDLWESGFISLRSAEDVVQRGRPIPPMVGTAFNYLLSQAETGMLCSVGMTSSLAGVVERHAPAEVRERFLPHLRTTDFSRAWDGAMFMTEIRGGSDLAASETRASWDGRRWLLNGAKWFCSNVDARVILTLARPDGAPEGLRGLALFLVPSHLADGSPNGIHVKRVKDKLGTRAVPTAEIDFVDAEAYLLAGERSDPSAATDGRGLRRMMEMVNDSRFGVAVMALGIMRRSFLEAAIYAAHRTAFGRLLQDLPLMRETLVTMVVELEAAAALAFETSEAAARVRQGDEWRKLSRILVPLLKFRVTRRGLETASQALEVFGGNGYIENWPMARQLRDAQCHTIWEGTENIIVLDVQRAIVREGAHEALFARVDRSIQATEHPLLTPAARLLEDGLQGVREALAYLATASPEVAQLQARRFAGYMADVAQLAALLDEAAFELASTGSARKAAIARIFADTHLSERPLRGITSGDRRALDLFDSLVRYQPLPRELVD